MKNVSNKRVIYIKRALLGRKMFFSNYRKFSVILLMSLLSANAYSICERDMRWSDACFYKKNGAVYVQKKYRKLLEFNQQGVAFIAHEDFYQDMLVNRQGRVIFKGVRFGGDSDFVEDMARFRPDGKNGKCGYFNAAYKTMIAPKYDECGLFQEGAAFVCNNCKEVCSDSECHDHHYFGDVGLFINKKGQVIKEGINISFENFCPAPGVIQNELKSTPPYISCNYTYGLNVPK